MNNEVNVGLTIKTIRTQKGISLKEVAYKSKISSSMLSQIESGSANPSLNSIRAIANVLDIPLFKLFLENTDNKKGIKIIKEEDRKTISTKDVNYELISPNQSIDLEFMKMTLKEKGAETSALPKPHKGEEVALLLSGEVKIIIGDSSAKMVAGDSVYIPASESHKWVNLSDGESIVLFAVTPSEF